MNRGTYKRVFNILKRSGFTYERILNLIKMKCLPTGKDGKLNWTPYALDIEPTTRCNLKCPMCTHTYWSRKEQDMSAEVFERIIRDIPSLIKVKLQGIGEPLLSPHFFELLEIAEKYKVCVHTISNGTTLTDTIIDKLYDSSLVELQISLDSPAKSTYEQIRVGADFDKTISKLERLCSHPKRKKMSISIWATIWNDSMHEAPKLVELCKRLGVDSLFLSFGLGNWGDAAVEQSIKGHRVLPNDTYLKIEKECRQTNINSPLILIIFPPSDRRGFQIKQCVWPKTSAFISCDGFVTPCCLSVNPEKFNFGNIKDKTFNEIWNGVEYAKFRKDIMNDGAPAPCHALCSTKTPQ